MNGAAEHHLALEESPSARRYSWFVDRQKLWVLVTHIPLKRLAGRTDPD